MLIIPRELVVVYVLRTCVASEDALNVRGWTVGVRQGRDVEDSLGPDRRSNR